MFRSHYSARHFVVPVVLYSVLFNIPKFFELTTSCPKPDINQSYLPDNISFQVPELHKDLNLTQEYLGHCKFGNLEVTATVMRSIKGWIRILKLSFVFPSRMNFWYLNIYFLWMNTILNIWTPIISLIVLNITIYRYRWFSGCNNKYLGRKIQEHMKNLVVGYGNRLTQEVKLRVTSWGWAVQSSGQAGPS